MPIAKPVADSNAIEAVAFVIQFEREFSETEIEALFALEQRLKQDLPSFQKIITFSVGVSENGASPVASTPIPSQRLAGILLQRFRENGKPDWVLRASSNQVAVNCLSYTRWADVSQKSLGFLLPAVQSVDSETNRVVTIATQFVDKFLYDTVPLDYDLGDVFRQDSPYITQQARASGNQWHVFQGWFFESEVSTMPKGKVLNVINLSSAIQNERLQAVIDHTSQITFNTPQPISDLIGASVRGGPMLLNDCFAYLHEQNKMIMRSTLTDAQLDAIQLV